jgi:hypothetical protein
LKDVSDEFVASIFRVEVSWGECNQVICRQVARKVIIQIQRRVDRRNNSGQTNRKSAVATS